MSEGEHNQSSSTLNIFIVFLTLALSALTFFEVDKQLNLDWDKVITLSVIGILALIATVIVNWKRINHFVSKKWSKIKRFNALTFENRKGYFEILDAKGKEVVYTEECLIKRIKKKFIYKGRIECSGIIDNSIQTFNCYNSLNNKNNEVTIVYGRKNGSNHDSIMNRRQLQYGYALTMRDSFTSKEESWYTECVHFTKLYDLKMSFPKKRPPKYVDIFQIRINKEGKPKRHYIPTDPLIIKKKNKVLVMIKLLHLQKGSKFEILWEW